MGFWNDLGKAASNPMSYAVGQIGGTEAKNTWNKVNLTGMLTDKYFDGTQPAAESPVSSGYDVTDWSKIGKDLNSSKLEMEQNNLQQASQASLADSSNNLAMKGGLSAGAGERLAKDNMRGFQDSYGQLATRYGLGGAEIEKQGLEKKWEQMANTDRAQAIKDSNKKSGLLGGSIINGIL